MSKMICTDCGYDVPCKCGEVTTPLNNFEKAKEILREPGEDWLHGDSYVLERVAIALHTTSQEAYLRGVREAVEILKRIESDHLEPDKVYAHVVKALTQYKTKMEGKL